MCYYYQTEGLLCIDQLIDPLILGNGGMSRSSIGTKNLLSWLISIQLHYNCKTK